MVSRVIDMRTVQEKGGGLHQAKGEIKTRTNPIATKKTSFQRKSGLHFWHWKEWEALERAICIIRAVASSRAQLAFLVCPLGSRHPPPHLGAFF
jgi:hypothetical protein